MIFEKIREKLDEECWLTTNDDGETNNLSEKVVSLKDAIDIINQAEVEVEYKDENVNIITDYLQFVRDNADNYDTENGWSLADLIDLSIKFSEKSEYNNGWISVKNELPEKFDSVLVSCEGSIVGGTHEGEKCEFVATGYMFSKDHWQIQGHNDVKYIKVIAWQPLPEPYTPKGE